MQLSPPTLQLRAARSSDAARVTSCYLSSYKALLQAFAPPPHVDAEAVLWVQDLLIPTGGVTVAVESGAVVGFIGVSQHAVGAWIDHLYVHPSHLRRGVGSTLLYLALARLTGPVRAYTFEANRVGRKFCERYGFSAIAFGDGTNNVSGAPDVLYERPANTGAR